MVGWWRRVIYAAQINQLIAARNVNTNTDSDWRRDPSWVLRVARGGGCGVGGWAVIGGAAVCTDCKQR